MAQRIHTSEFVAILAMMMASVAFAIDSMLPAMPEMAQELTPENTNNIQLVLSFFMGGLGIGTLFTGPLSDSLGRKPVVIGGALVYMAGALISWQANSLEMLVIGRMIQGLGASAARIIAIAIIRDLYSGREMAKLVSFVMIVFTIFPAMSPLIGSFIIDFGGWRAIYIAYLVFAVIYCGWFTLRIKEPLPKEHRRKFSPTSLWAALKEMMAIPMVRLTIIVQVLVISTMFTSISLIEPNFERIFNLGDQFPYWFFGMGVVAGTASMVNAALVVKYGMRRIISVAITTFLGLCVLMLICQLSGIQGTAYFAAYIIWQASIFYMMGLTMGNLNALAMEPVGHIAGLAASVIGAISTICGAVVSTLVAQIYDGTIMPQLLASIVFAAIARAVMVRISKLERTSDTATAKEGPTS